MPDDRDRVEAGALAGLLSITGVAHFLVPALYDPLIPHSLPGATREWVLASGVAELVCAATIAHRRIRPLGASAAAILFVAVFPANVKMAVDWNHQGAVKAALAWARLPLQVPLIWWALRVRRASHGDARKTG